MSAAAAIKPEAAKPIAVAPKELIAINELAAASSCSEATSGSTLSWAGSKNCPTALDRATMTYSQTMLSGTRKGIENTNTARIKSAVTIMRRRSKRSTNTPAISPTTRLGAAVAININPTLAAEPVIR